MYRFSDFIKNAMNGSIKERKLLSIALVLSFVIQPFLLYYSPISKGASPENIKFLFFSLIALLNLICIRELIYFFGTEHKQNAILKEFALIALLAISNIGMFAGIYFYLGIDVSHDTIPDKGNYTNSVYFSIVTWTTLGYGDFKPIESLRIVAALEAFLGYVYMALLVGILLNTTKIKVLEQ